MTSSAPDEYLILVHREGSVEYQLVMMDAGTCLPPASHKKAPSNTDRARLSIWRSDVRATGLTKRSMTLKALMPLSVQLFASLSCADSTSAWYGSAAHASMRTGVPS